MKYLFGACVFVLSLVFGYGFFVQFFDYENQKRSTASLKNNYDLTCLTGEELTKAIKHRIINGFKTTRKDGYLGLNLGHFTFADPSADRSKICGKQKDRDISSALQVVSKKIACKEYPKLSLYFSADQESTSGAKRQLLVEANCEVSSDLSQTEVVWIPWEQIAQETPFEGDTQYNKPSKVLVKTTDISDSWPGKWYLNKIQLTGEAGQIEVNETEIREIAGRPMAFEFK